jgi:hypothetical protein
LYAAGAVIAVTFLFVVIWLAGGFKPRGDAEIKYPWLRPLIAYLGVLINGIALLRRILLDYGLPDYGLPGVLIAFAIGLLLFFPGYWLARRLNAGRKKAEAASGSTTATTSQ